MQKKLHIKVGDQVKVISGNYKGSEGKVLSVDREKERAVVEGVNLISKHVKPNAANPQGGIVKREAGVHISNLMLVVGGVAQRTAIKVEDGKKQRVGVKTKDVVN
ncbi:MAG: 50S ribosomal protein L24 [Luteibaculum sp.]